jgi:hypothetical protein
MTPTNKVLILLALITALLTGCALPPVRQTDPSNPPLEQTTAATITPPAPQTAAPTTSASVLQEPGAVPLTETPQTTHTLEPQTPSPQPTVTAIQVSISDSAPPPIPGGNLKIDLPTYLDKLHGGWVGQMAGVQWGAPTEFKYRGQINPEKITWHPETINQALENDDLYVEIPFLEMMATRGVNASWGDFGEGFRWTGSNLWHGNKDARQLLNQGFGPPLSGHYTLNPHAEDIDWQIEANFAGLVTPGMPDAAIDIAWRAGHVIGYGDGVYGGVAVAAMTSAAFFAESVDEIIEAGRLSVPEGSQYREMIDDVIAWSDEYPADWGKTWQKIEDKWGEQDRCPEGINKPFNIDAKLNGAYVFMGLLYGNGNFENSMYIAMKGGQDSDCNPSTVGGILGTWLGLSDIPYKFYEYLDPETPILYTDHTYNDAINMSVDAARQVVLMKGGSIEDSGGTETWVIPPMAEIQPAILEQWPRSSNDPPLLTIAVEQTSGCRFKMSASASDSNQIHDIQWFFGDLSYANGVNTTHTYQQSGSYEITAFASDRTGNTSWKTQGVTCE